ncbi:MAG: DNA repair protein RadA [Peptoniphilaceae bacterium]|nr:DNA repair protein RadA [Peptoniphilaceae bacterium]MDY6085376.1 DNA repair protein RadA [Peptoniphilaceae bacterium]
MATKTRYQCSECGHISIGWAGRCPACGAWSTMQEITVETGAKRAQKRENSSLEALPLTRVSLSQSARIDLGSEELNRVLGGGLVPDSVTMLTAKPGAGKSTLLLQVAGTLASRGMRVLYASGEESSAQIRARAERVLPALPEEIYLMATSSLDAILKEAKRLGVQVMMIDSIQTMELSDYPQRPGTPTQTVACTAAIIDACKSEEHPMASFVIGHVTKEETMAGLRTLEHQVDTVLYLESGLSDALRLLRTTKNRFGFTDEVGLFQMGAEGLSDVTDPYDLFLTRRERPISGAAIAFQSEGSRMIPVEIEALVSDSYDAYPTRIGDSLSRDALNTLVSILEQRAGISLGKKNVVLKATGGLRIREKATDLAILVAIASAAEGFAVSGKDVFLAEVGLTGELKRVREWERRVREVARMGFTRVFIAAEYAELKRSDDAPEIERVAVKTLSEVLDALK